MTAAGLLCGSCGTELGEKDKFCSECGAAVTSAPKAAEYKQVTRVPVGLEPTLDGF
jgi:adenylate cyclase